jgi:hypothetical protein
MYIGNMRQSSLKPSKESKMKIQVQLYFDNIQARNDDHFGDEYAARLRRWEAEYEDLLQEGKNKLEKIFGELEYESHDYNGNDTFSGEVDLSKLLILINNLERYEWTADRIYSLGISPYLYMRNVSLYPSEGKGFYTLDDFNLDGLENRLGSIKEFLEGIERGISLLGAARGC